MQLKKHRAALRLVLFRFVAVVMSLVVSLAALEVLLHLVEARYPRVNQFYYVRQATGQKFLYDSLLGYRNFPNMVVRYGDNRLTINSKGLRGPEYGYNKPPEVQRILVLGDSFTWGYAMSDEQVFARVLERRLRQWGRYQVINSGVSSYGTDQEYLFLREEGYKYSPDLIVLAFFVGNDFDDNVHAAPDWIPKPVFHSPRLDLGNVPVPIYSQFAGGYLRPARIYDCSAIYRFLFVGAVRWPLMRQVMAGCRLLEAPSPPEQPGNVDPVELTVSIVAAISHFCQARGCPLVVMKFGSGLLDGRPHIDNWVGKFEQELSLLKLPIHYLDLDEQFASEGVCMTDVIGSDGYHWNAEGHRHAGKILARYLHSEGLVAASGTMREL